MEVLAILSFIPGLALLLISVFVLHEYQKNTGNIPGSFQFWMFHEEMRAHYPKASKVARILTLVTIILALPWFINSIFNIVPG